jgi:DNA-binding transcriptional MerR regulator/methylmalonyl-CoA mutase cobalamin-binding subunit
MNTKRTAAPSASIATVERDTGLSKDTLRVWERRYGFPKPSRDSNGERVYPADQLEKLRVIRRLMDSGLRPGAVVAEPLQALNARVKALPARAPLAEGESSAAIEALRLLESHQVVPLRLLLTHALVQRGLQRFVIEVVAPLNELVGNAWIEGELQIFEEHLYAEQLQHLLRQAIGSLSLGAQGPRILLTTLPGEQHKLGLLMAEACLAAEGAQCISLGVQTPAWDIVQAARAHRVDIVGLSFSQAMPVKTARDGVSDLRKRLDRKIGLWAGGSLWHRTHKSIPGVLMMASLTAIPEALQAWRAQHAVD